MIKKIDTTSVAYASRSKEIDLNKDSNIEQISNDLIDTIKTLEDRPYLCSNEIGYTERVMCLRFENDDIKIFVNPLIQDRDKLEFTREIDRNSTSKTEYILPRYKEIVLMYQDSDGRVYSNKFTEDAAVIIGQAIDQLDGIHISEYGLEVLPEFDLATEEERAELLAAYVDELKKLHDSLDNELTDDEETKRLWTSLKYEKARREGKVEVEKVVYTSKMSRRERRLLRKLENRAKKRGNNNG